MKHSSLSRAHILLPYDGSPSARMAIQLAAALAAASGEAVQGITLLRVLAGSYLSRHLQNVDLRVTRLDQNTEWQRIQQHYLEEEIKPLLVQGQELLRQQGFQGPIELKIVEGKIGATILEVAQSGDYSTIIMGRRGLSPVKELWMGSATHYVMTRARGLTVFVVGPEQADIIERPIFPLLVPVDGSEASLEVVRQAADLAQAAREHQPQITLIHVLDLALLGLTLPEEAELLLEEGQKALAAGRQILDQAGLGEFTQEKLVPGHPAQAIAQEAESQPYALVYMGSVGHSALGRLFIGSITNSVLHLVTRSTLAVAFPSRNLFS
jgi:nucleotide-binding universal stress UspA family protein